ncbi:hypothetical protein GGU10DRAFT_408492 [Lentinula aff. detonsa]|uniref:Uncharacterized protein n=1 Tax=Lentinula aff. detonsa TaxID=2804958 RepID=A0AA38K8N9_9AGAR|nr:hypothetical protein GGU10DRAFT_408492 [Lentinula aff. detonsa]
MVTPFDAVHELFHYIEDDYPGNSLNFGETEPFPSATVIFMLMICCSSAWLQKTVNTQGRRSSSATSNLALESLARSNLDVLLNTRVARILPSLSTHHFTSSLSLRTVESAQNLNGAVLSCPAPSHEKLSNPVQRMTAALLSAGVIDSHQIATTTLSQLGMKTLVNLPSVGRNLTNQSTKYLQRIRR